MFLMEELHSNEHGSGLSGVLKKSEGGNSSQIHSHCCPGSELTLVVCCCMRIFFNQALIYVCYYCL